MITVTRCVLYEYLCVGYDDMSNHIQFLKRNLKSQKYVQTYTHLLHPNNHSIDMSCCFEKQLQKHVHIPITTDVTKNKTFAKNSACFAFYCNLPMSLCSFDVCRLCVVNTSMSPLSKTEKKELHEINRSSLSSLFTAITYGDLWPPLLAITIGQAKGPICICSLFWHLHVKSTVNMSDIFKLYFDITFKCTVNKITMVCMWLLISMMFCHKTY